MHPAAIGPYKIERELGRGGMGEVYLARDTRLDRQVAIKAMPAHLASDPDRLARFQREAKVLASLNHPNIGAIYGLEEADAHRYLILEFVDGQTLADRLAEGPLPLGEALSIAKQIAEALEAAHEKGVVHRDLKPANVMTTPDGTVKVLDFGLARTEEGPQSSVSVPALANSPTITSPAILHSPTIPGVIMGTAGYMSPEQARGKAVDKRSDIFSFGCVFYEMLTGVMPFRGETVADAIGATLHKESDLSLLPLQTPPRVRDLLSSCLAKDRKHRLHDIGDARLQLERALNEPLGAVAGPGGPRRAWSLTLPWAIVGVMAITAATFPLWSSRFGLGGTTPAPKPVVRFIVEPPAGHTLPPFISNGTGLAVSPAGDRIVFGVVAHSKPYLCVRELSDDRPRVLPNTEGCFNPFFSPDGKWLGYVSKGRLMKMSAAGGPSLTVCEVGDFSRFEWLDDGTIVWGSGVTGLWRVSADGGVPVQLAKVGSEAKTLEPGLVVIGINDPLAVPGADYILACGWDGFTTEEYRLYAVSLKDGTIRSVLKAATEPRLIARDRLVFTRGTTVMSVGFDPASGAIVGEPTVALENVRTDQWMDTAFLGASISGTFAYVPGGRFGADRRLVRVDETGKIEPMLDAPDNFSSLPDISPDGRKAVLTTLRQRSEMWVLDLDRRSMSLVASEGEMFQPHWSADGTSIVASYTEPSGVNGIARWPAGGGKPSILPGTSNAFPTILQELPDASGALVQIGGLVQPSRPDLALYDYAKASTTPVRNTPAGEGPGCLSPDGKWIAYVSDESGSEEVYLGPFGAPAPNVQVSAGGGSHPRFSPDGKRLFFIDGSHVVMAATIDIRGSEPRVSAPTKLFDAKSLNLVTGFGPTGFDMLSDGGFVMLERAAWEREPPAIHVTLNWPQELAAKSAAE